MRRPLAAIIAAVAVAQIWMAHRYFGFMTGDDVEVLSEAFRRARGLDFHPWDIRNLFVPDIVVAPVVWIMRGASTRTTIFAASLPFVVLTALTIALVYRLALQWCDDDRAALVAALLFATHWIPLGFGSTVYPRTLAAACVVGAALLVERWPFVAGALVGLAFADRFSEIVFIAPLAVIVILSRPSLRSGPLRMTNLPFRAGGEEGGEETSADGAGFAPRQQIPLPPSAPPARNDGSVTSSLTGARAVNRLRMTGWVLAGCLVSTALTVGLYDWLTWGAPFSSLTRFAHLTLVAPDFASRVKYQAPWWYVANLVRWLSPLLLPLLWYARRSRAIWFIVIPLLAFSAVRHKELRYLQVLIPFIMVAAAIGFAALRQNHRRIAVTLVAVSVVWNLYGLRYFARKSQPAVEAAQWIASNPQIHSVAVSQLWAFGDKLYFGDRIGQTDLGTPPDGLNDAVSADMVALYDTDLDVPSRIDRLRVLGYTPVRTFRDDPARAVVVFMRP